MRARLGDCWTDLGLAREIHRQIGGSANEVGARLFEGRGGAPLDEMEIGIPYDILRLLAADAAPGKSVHWRGPDISPQGQR